MFVKKNGSAANIGRIAFVFCENLNISPKKPSKAAIEIAEIMDNARGF